MKSGLILAIIGMLIINLALYSQNDRKTLFVDGRYLYTPCLDKVVLRGVNKMIIWTDDLELRKLTYSEIRKTGANCVRIVWLANPVNGENDSGPAGMDRAIQECIDNDMIPMVELHDATGYWPGLQACVNYWLKPEVLAIVKKHEAYLLLNIANECGDETVTDEQFKSGYGNAVDQLRADGIKVPLVIDAADWGKNLEQLRRTGSYLQNVDSEHNLLFSVHMYWAISDGADEQFITNEISQSVQADLPFIVGEFSYKFNREGGCNYETDYRTIIKLCQENDIGWLAWEWGPGNEFADPSCDIMNMTADSHYNTLHDNWAKVLAVTSPYSIMNTSVTPDYIINGGVCDQQDVESLLYIEGSSLQVNPNPCMGQVILSYKHFKPETLLLKTFNALGQLVVSKYVNQMKSGELQYVFPAGCPNGIYSFILTDGRNTSTVNVFKISD
jgi:mannan endo-1,4-beta-mannosidase